MRRFRVAALAVLVLVLAGCSEIPTVGAVQPGTTEAPNGTSFVYVPNPPADGAKPQDVVNGFVAAASAGGALRVAKEYLTPEFAKQWDPGSRVLVQQAQPTVTANGTSEVRLEVPVAATVSAKGVYTTDSGTRPLDFHLTQVRGQWRIDDAPDGIVVNPIAFQRNYKPAVLQFFDQAWTRLVPDPRWFPNNGATATVAADVSALIDGPAGPVSGGVTSNALHGATLQSVDLADTGVTTVSLRLPQADPTDDALDRIQQQLLKTLQLPTPSALRLFVNDRVVQPVSAILSRSPQQVAFGVVGGRFGTVSPTGAFAENAALGKQVMAAQPRAITVSTRQGLAAVLTRSADVAVVTTSGRRTVDTRPGVIAPTVDQRGWTYSVPGESPNGIQAVTARGRPVALDTDLQAASVKAIEVSPDGTRMLLLVASASGSPQAFVAGILRSPDGTPTGLTDETYAVDLGGRTGSGIDATWVDDTDVAVLVNAYDGSTERIQEQQLGGLPTSLGELPGAAAIVGTSDVGDLRLLLATGRVYVWQNPYWQEESPASPNVSVLAVQR